MSKKRKSTKDLVLQSKQHKTISFPCLKCNRETDVQNAKFCIHCCAHPYRSCFVCHQSIELGQCAYVVEAEDLMYGYCSLAHRFNDPYCPIVPRTYYHYREDPWLPRRRQNMDYSAWQTLPRSSERIRMLPSCIKCFLHKIPIAIDNCTWPCVNTATETDGGKRQGLYYTGDSHRANRSCRTEDELTLF